MPQIDPYFGYEQDATGTTYLTSGDEVLVVALLADGQVACIREPSPALGTTVLVLPGGSTEVGEDHAATANRELQEEIGQRANRLDFLGELMPWSKYLTVRSFVYLGRDLAASRLQGDENYTIDLQPVSLDNIEQLLATGQLHDARVIAALYLTRAFLARNGQ